MFDRAWNESNDFQLSLNFSRRQRYIITVMPPALREVGVSKHQQNGQLAGIKRFVSMIPCSHLYILHFLLNIPTGYFYQLQSGQRWC